MKRRSVASSARNNCRGNSNPIEELDIITHKSVYGQVKESQLAQNEGVVYEQIKDNFLMRSRPMSCMVLCNTTHHAMRILIKPSQGVNAEMKLV